MEPGHSEFSSLPGRAAAAAAQHGNSGPAGLLPGLWPAPAALWEGTQVRLPVSVCPPASSLPAPTPPHAPLPQADPEADLLPAEDDEESAARGGGRRSSGSGSSSRQETGPLRASHPAVCRIQSREEVGSQLPETQAQREARVLTPGVTE